MKKNNLASKPPFKFKAVCTECGSPCQVPFKPREGSAVLCNSCFRKPEGAPPKRSGSRPYAGKSRPGGEDVADQLSKMNAKLDAVLRELVLLRNQL